MTLTMELGRDSYDILLERGALQRAGQLLNLRRRVMIVTDDGVPQAYAAALARQCGAAEVLCLPSGEGSKTLSSFERICRRMMELQFTRGDCVAALGGGVCGDLAGFAASAYMRGVDFYNIPTTLLSQVDSSIGGKTGVNLDGVKNMVGAFYQPRRVLIDPDTLDTLSQRQTSAGAAEAVKMAASLDAELFCQLEGWRQGDDLTPVIEGSLRIKKRIVELDEREGGPRRLLNFGHTIGHGVESAAHGGLYHGECVAVGMLPMCAPGVRPRLAAVLERFGLPTRTDLPRREIWQAMQHDKKMEQDGAAIVWLEQLGDARIKKVSAAQLNALLEEAWQE